MKRPDIIHIHSPLSGSDAVITDPETIEMICVTAETEGISVDAAIDLLLNRGQMR
jgi:hypothetical protein